MPLKKYNKKRNFKITSEPYGETEKTHPQLRFVVQKHAASHLHYDFRLEMNGVLKSWAVPKGPSLDPSVKRLAVHVEDHPLSYGSFEGTIPKGQYGGGTVVLWDKGTWECEDKNTLAAYKKGNLTFRLHGKKLKGLWKLIRLKNDPKNWLLFKENDSYAKSADEYDILEAEPNSVKGKKSYTAANKIDTLKTIKLPAKLSPELATLIDKPPQGNEWLHEIKFDGYRLLAFLNGKQVRLMTRNNNDWTDKFPYLVKELQKLKLTNTILDGEIIVYDDKKHSDFQLLQNSIHADDTKNILYYLFDLPFFNSKNLTDLPLLTRKQELEELIPLKNTRLQFSSHIIGQGEKLFKEACKLGLEGIVAKNIHSKYVQKRSKNWLKIKCIQRQEFIVVGFTHPQGSRAYFGSLLLAVNSQDKLVYCGHVGTGFTGDSLQTMHDMLQKYITKDAPIKQVVGIKNKKSITWVRPKIIVEVEFSAWTKDNILRHPSFKGIRSDKRTKQISYEKPEEITIVKNKGKKTMLDYPFTHPDKILFPEPEISKLNLAEYYQKVHSLMLPYLIKRPLTIVRCPQGLPHKCFYQKHLNEAEILGIYTIPIREKSGKQPYLYIKDETGLMALVQMGVLEIHTWGCHVDKIEKPDLITFDLDPGDDVPWKKVIETAFFVKEQLEKLKLVSFVKITGGKGLHVVLPIQRQYGWDEIEVFARTFVDYLVMQKPDLYLANMSKAKRKGKIFLDYLRNQRGATAITPYSTRAKVEAPLALPIAWDELSAKIKPNLFTVNNIDKYLRAHAENPWEDFFLIKQKLRLPK